MPGNRSLSRYHGMLQCTQWAELFTFWILFLGFPVAGALTLRCSQSILPKVSRVPDAVTFLSTRASPCTSRTSTTLAMSLPVFHLGHSHAHNDHVHHHDQVPPRSNVSSKQKAQQIRRQRRRRFALSIFCALATVASKMIQQRPFQKTDWLVMTLSIVAVSSADKVRRNLLNYFQKLRGLGDAIAKHSGGNHRSKSASSSSISFLSSSPQTTGKSNEADRVTWIGVVINVLLSAGKLAVGITQHSSVLIADAGHSFSDLISDFITLWSVRVARLPPDEDHPYGHTKFEAIGSLFLSLTLIATGLSVGAMAQKQLMPFLSGNAIAAAAASVTVPGPLALFMAGLSIASKEWLYRITKAVGEKLNSPIVIANAWHHRSDAYSSVLALLSIAATMFGFAAADAAAGLLVAGMIGMTGCDIMVESIQQLSDSAHFGLQDDLQTLIERYIEADPDVLRISSIRARQVGSAAFCDVTVEISPKLSTTATRAVEERLKKYLVKTLSKITGQVITATVHAKAPLVVCPLLEAADTTTSGLQEESDDKKGHNNVDESTRPKPNPGLSANQVEMRVRQHALLLDPQHGVQSVTVHYESPQSVSVDVTIRPTSASDLSQLQIRAKRLQHGLEDQISEIQSARIYLDLLNESHSSGSPSATQRSVIYSNDKEDLDHLSILPSHNSTVFETLWNGSQATQNFTSLSVERMP